MAAKPDLTLELRRLADRIATLESEVRELRSAGRPKCACGKLAVGRVRIFEGPIRTARDIYACSGCAAVIEGQPV